MKWIYVLCSITIVCFFSSCYDEKTLTPTEDGEGMIRYEFPQGTNSWDKDIEEIAEKFHVYLIYKNFKTADFNRSWTGMTGAVFMAGDLTDEQAEFSTNFMKNHVFAYLNEKVLAKVLPMYYYMAYDYHYIWRLEFGGMVLMEQKVMMSDVYDGMDFWAVCLYAENDDTEMEISNIIEPPVTKEDFYYRRGEILLHILDKSFEKGNIEVPVGFGDGIDYKTEVKWRYGDEDDENYYIKRGFPGIMEVFDKDGFKKLEGISSINNIKNFLQYIHLGMYYTKEALEKKMPQAKYPLIWEKRNFVVNYMKTNYDIDLEAIAEGPEIN